MSAYIGAGDLWYNEHSCCVERWRHVCLGQQCWQHARPGFIRGSGAVASAARGCRQGRFCCSGCNARPCCCPDITGGAPAAPDTWYLCWREAQVQTEQVCQLLSDTQYSLGKAFTAQSYCEVVQANTTGDLPAHPAARSAGQRCPVDRPRAQRTMLAVIQLLPQLSAARSEISSGLTGDHCCSGHLRSDCECLTAPRGPSSR
jgi:hypothetical protein